MVELLITLACGAAVGLSLGLTGGGGSLFALPLLVYVLDIPLNIAVPASLLVVGLTALVGSLDALRHYCLVSRALYPHHWGYGWVHNFPKVGAWVCLPYSLPSWGCAWLAQPVR